MHSSARVPTRQAPACGLLVYGLPPQAQNFANNGALVIGVTGDRNINECCRVNRIRGSARWAVVRNDDCRSRIGCQRRGGEMGGRTGGQCRHGRTSDPAG